MKTHSFVKTIYKNYNGNTSDMAAKTNIQKKNTIFDA